ncbi:type II toxin-antitoxin system death-on-curing family toxin [Oceanithermus sp.]
MPEYLSRRLVLALHHDLIETFGGSLGLRDSGRLEAALAAPLAGFAGVELYPSLEAKAAAYLVSLARNHPFIDGNKRTAFAATDVFLRLNGRRLALGDDELFDLVQDAAQGRLGVGGVAQVFANNLDATS